MEGLGGGHLGLGSVGTSAVGSFPSSLSSMTSTPGSPAKAFPNINVSQPNSQPFNPMQSMQNLTSQLQGKTTIIIVLVGWLACADLPTIMILVYPVQSW